MKQKTKIKEETIQKSQFLRKYCIRPKVTTGGKCSFFDIDPIDYGIYGTRLKVPTGRKYFCGMEPIT